MGSVTSSIDFYRVPALKWLAEQLAHQGLRVNYHIDSTDVPKFEADQADHLFQAVRELLINVVKHASVSEALVSSRNVTHNSGSSQWKIKVLASIRARRIPAPMVSGSDFSAFKKERATKHLRNLFRVGNHG